MIGFITALFVQSLVVTTNWLPRARPILVVLLTSESVVELAIYRQSVRLGVKPLETQDQHFFFQMNPCGYNPYITILWREDVSVVYNSFWLSPEQSFSGLSPRELKTKFYYLRFETSPTWRARSPDLYPPRTGFSLFFTSYDSQGYGGGTRICLHAGSLTSVKVKVKVTLRLTVYRQSVRLGVKPLETHEEIFFSTELLR
jgi:hypothetical protein